MIIWFGNEEHEFEELTREIEFDIVCLEVIIEKLIQYKELKGSTLKMLKSLLTNGTNS